MMTGQEMFLDDAERAAAAVGTNTAGGFLVPTHLDPTLIFTNTGTTNAVRGVSRVVQLTTGNVWNGVTTAGSTFSFDSELAEVSDDTPSFGRVSIPLFAARGFVQASLEMLLDTDVTGDLAAIFADGKDRLEASNYILGGGSTAPKGIVVCLDANTNDELATTTANALGAVDIDAAYRHVGPRWRGKGTWLMNPLFEGKIRLLATTLGSQFTTDLTGPYTSVLYNKPVIEADEMPALLTTTGQNIAVYGDFSQFLIVDQPGSYSLQYIPALFNTTSNLPDGRVGWFASWRTGSKSVNDTAFTLLQNA
jgi:HK97 family phage major capsid protein